MALTERYEQALIYAHQVHSNQVRKSTTIPYIAHLLSVLALVLENGGDEDEAIAGLLHDAPEDQGGRHQLAEIRRRFGERVAQIVDGCTDTYEDPKPPWRERKTEYLAHLADASASVIRVSLADKLHNARALLLDYRILGEAVFQRFRAGKPDQLWYYERLLEEFKKKTRSPLLDELERTVSELRRLALAKAIS